MDQMEAKMETKFTPGPWERREGAEWIIDSTNAGYGRVASVGLGRDEAVANAHLIAAAPTMAGYIKRKADEGCKEAAHIWEQINAC